MKKIFLISIRLTLVCLLFFDGFYMLLVSAFATLTPGKGNGNRIRENGMAYYVNVGQLFSSDQYFWSRPSAVDYNAAGSAGSNKGPSNPDYIQVVSDRIDTFLVHNSGILKKDIPSELVTASGSGLDPDISVQAARVQALRIARVRNINQQKVNELINGQIEKPVFGPEIVNVLTLNLKLDKLTNDLKKQQ